MLTTPLRLLKFALQDFGRNIWLTTTTVVILTLTLLSVHVLLAVNVAGQIALHALESRVDLRVQFRSSIAESEVDATRIDLEQREEVASVEHRSRAQVLAEFRELHRGNADVLAALDELGENPFGPELRMQLRRPEDFPALARLFEEPAFAGRVAATSASDGRVLVERLTVVTDRVRLVGMVMSALSFAVTLLIIINAMRIATYARREEVGIMKLVGATNWFVRTPFLIMGVLASALATGLAYGITTLVLRVIAPTLRELLGPRGVDMVLFFRDHAGVIVGAEILSLSLLTVFISALALRRYLRV
ncbi:hypothetical protein HYV74_02695 [Candidatus Uhrbacteria bacterium]|nr:hypothetical protein [Candidatus Uhrbacteria bacterium]